MARKKRIDFNSINLQAMESFQDEIETIRKGSDSYIDAIIQYCSQNQGLFFLIDLEHILRQLQPMQPSHIPSIL